jgi:histone-lysine N-methyltransferase SETMAR
MDVTKENYRFFIETLRRNGASPAEICKTLTQAWKEDAPSQATVYRVYHELANGTRDSFQDNKRSGRPKSSCIAENVKEINAIINHDPHVTIRELVNEVGISFGSIYTIVTVHLQLTSLCSRWVPHSLTDEQKQQRVLVAKEWLRTFQECTDEELSERLVAVDEKYFYHRTLGRKLSNRAWCLDESERPEIARRVMHDHKSHVICASGFGGKFHFEVLERGESINSERFVSFLQDMHHKFVHQQNVLGWKKLLLIMDNARPHTSKKTLDFLSSKGVKVLRQPPYSPDFNLCDRWLFSELEKIRRRVNFSSAAELFLFLQESLTQLDKNAIQRQLEHLKKDLLAVIDARGSYL